MAWGYGKAAACAAGVTLLCAAGCGDGGRPSAPPRAQGPQSFILEPGTGGARLVARGTRGALALRDRGPAFALKAGARQAVVRLDLPVARRPAPELRLPGIVNDYRGNDPARWRSNLPTHARARYREVWRGIDVLVHGSRGQVEYDFVVRRGADPSDIAVRIAGGRPRIDADGDLVVATKAGRLVQRAPVLYQQGPRGRELVSGRFVLEGRTLRFRVGRYDRGRTLVIDPVIVWSTFNGGNGYDYPRGVAVGPGDTVVATGETQSSDFPQVNPADGSSSETDVFVTKFAADGATRVFSTYLSGTGDDLVGGAAVASDGNVVVAGRTFSTDFPTTAGAFDTSYNGNQDAWATVLGPTGALVRSTYLGGALDEGAEAVAAGGSGQFTVGGFTRSTDFPTTRGAVQTASGGSTDGFVAVLSTTSNSVLAGTYYGGSGVDRVKGLAYDSASASYVATGETTSTNLPGVTGSAQPTLSGGTDVFAARYSFALSSRAWATYIGGSSDEEAGGVARDASGDAILAGSTQSANFPTAAAPDGTLGGSIDGYVVRLDGATGAREVSTYLGDADDQRALGVAVAPGSGHVWVAGASGVGAAIDAAVWRFTSSLSALMDTTVLAPSGTDTSQDFITGVAAASDGDAVVTGVTTGDTFPTTAGVVQPAKGAEQDTFVTRLDDDDLVPPQTTITGGPTGSVRGASQSFSFTSNEAGSTFRCSVDTNPDVACSSPYTAVVSTTGSHTFRVHAIDPAGNADDSSATRRYTVYALAPTQPDTVITAGPSGLVAPGGQSFTFAASPAEAGATFECRIDDAAAFTACSSPQGLPTPAPGPHTFRVRLKDAGGVVDPTPAERSFTVASAPETVIVSGPSGQVDSPDQTVTFAAQPEQAGVRFECRLDAGDFAPCESPRQILNLPVGAHTFAVRAVNSIDMPDATPAQTSFEVLGPKPPAQPAQPAPQAPAAPAPVARLRDVIGAVAGEAVVLDASDSENGVEFRFDTDGNGSYERDGEGLSQVAATFEQAGRFPVGVQVVGTDGRTSTAQASVVVSDPVAAAQPKIPGGDGVVRVGEKVTFSQGVRPSRALRAAGAPLGTRIYTYDFGDGSTRGRTYKVGGYTFENVFASKAASATHVFTTPGTYTFKIESTGDGSGPLTSIGQLDVVDAQHEKGSAKHPVLTYAFAPALGQEFEVRLEAGESRFNPPPIDDGAGGKVQPDAFVTETGTATFTWDTRSRPEPELSGSGVEGHVGRHTYATPGIKQLTGTYRPDGGGSASTVTVPVEVAKPVCTTMPFGSAKVTPAPGTCLTPFQNGYLTAPGAAVLMGGVRIQPAVGHRIYVEPKTLSVGPEPGDPGGPKMTLSQDGVTYAQDQYRLQFVANGATLVASGSNPTATPLRLNGFVIAAYTLRLNGGLAGSDLALLVPAPFNDTAEKTLGNPKAALDLDFEFEVPDIDLGPIKAHFVIGKHGGLIYGGGGLKIFSTSVDFPHIAPDDVITVDGEKLAGPSGFGFDTSGHFLYGGLTVKDLPPILGVIKIDKLKAQIITSPFYFRGEIEFGVPAAKAFVQANVCVQMQQLTKGDKVVRCGPGGAKTYAECMEVEGLSPNLPPYAATLLGSSCPALEKQAKSSGFYLYARGKAVVAKIVPVKAYVDYRDTKADQVADFGIFFDYPFGVFFSARGGIEGTFFFKPKFRWQVIGSAALKILGHEVASAQILANDRLLAGCIDIETVLVGATYTWDTHDVNTFGDGNPFTDEVCNLKQRFGFSSRALVAPRDLRATGGPFASMAVNDLKLGSSPRTQIVLHGASGAPRVDLVGPGGVRITDTDDGRETVTGPGYTIEHFPLGNITQIGIAKPKAGGWKVELHAGSSAVDTVRVLEPQPKPVVRAKVVKRDGRYVLRYLAERAPGRTVTFMEQLGDKRERVIGTATAKQGGIRFDPALGQVGTRKITASIEQHGALQSKVAVASYRAPVTDKVPAPVVRLTRKPGRAIVSWTPVARAEHYEVRITTSQGHEFRAETKRTSVTFRRFIDTVGAEVRVKAIDKNKLASPAAQASAKALRTLPKPRIVARVKSTRRPLRG